MLLPLSVRRRKHRRRPRAPLGDIRSCPLMFRPLESGCTRTFPNPSLSGVRVYCRCPHALKIFSPHSSRPARYPNTQPFNACCTLQIQNALLRQIPIAGAVLCAARQRTVVAGATATQATEGRAPVAARSCRASTTPTPLLPCLV